jgi:hypothetical protein
MRACTRHGVRTGEASPKGARWLCQRCVVLCEGGTNEPVGVDEVTGCASCHRHVCERHQAACAVDGKVHCSSHLRRADASRRLLCEAHRTLCVAEAGVVVGTDEVVPCATCGGSVCQADRARCTTDGAEHCRTHLVALSDRPGELACQQHHVRCHVDGAACSPAGAPACPICLKPACARHTRECASCGRTVCRTDLGGDTRCATCRSLTPDPDPEDRLIEAVLHANRGEPPKAKAWRTARDGSHTVVELDLGWTRRLVVAVRHGESRAEVGRRRAVWGNERV